MEPLKTLQSWLVIAALICVTTTYCLQRTLNLLTHNLLSEHNYQKSYNPALDPSTKMSLEKRLKLYDTFLHTIPPNAIMAAQENDKHMLTVLKKFKPNALFSQPSQPGLTTVFFGKDWIAQGANTYIRFKSANTPERLSGNHPSTIRRQQKARSSPGRYDHKCAYSWWCRPT